MLHKIDASLPETVCGTEQETTDVCRQMGYKAEYGDYNVPRETSKKNIIVEFLSRIISYSSANYVTIRYFLIPLIMYVLVQLLLNVELK